MIKRRNEDGTGMLDVIVATSLMSVFILVVSSLLASATHSELTSALRADAIALASDVASQAVADGCGTVTGYGSLSGAQAIQSRCNFGDAGGNMQVSTLGDVAMPGVDGNYTAFCPIRASELPGPACYRVPGTTALMTAGVSYSWRWSSNTPDLGGIFDGQPVSSPPDELLVQSAVAWGVNGDYTIVDHVARASPPDLLSSGWATGGMGMVLVDISGVTSPVPVGLLVPGWGEVSPMVTSYQQNGQQFGVFAYIPVGSGYRVWAGAPGNTSADFTVRGGEWSVVQAPL